MNITPDIDGPLHACPSCKRSTHGSIVTKTEDKYHDPRCPWCVREALDLGGQPFLWFWCHLHETPHGEEGIGADCLITGPFGSPRQAEQWEAAVSEVPSLKERFSDGSE